MPPIKPVTPLTRKSEEPNGLAPDLNANLILPKGIYSHIEWWAIRH
jgi:hypothetical protein